MLNGLTCKHCGIVYGCRYGDVEEYCVNCDYPICNLPGQFITSGVCGGVGCNTFAKRKDAISKLHMPKATA